MLLFMSFITASVIIAITSVKAQPSEVWVDDDFTPATPGWGTTHFDKIQDGIDAVANGGTVNVAAGTYTATSISSIVITKPLTLSGESMYNTIIDGGMWGASGAGWPKGIHSYADNVIIEQFTIQGFTGDLISTGGYGVVFRDYAHDDETQGETYIYYTNCILRNVRVLDCYSSIYALVHTYLTIEDCFVQDSLSDGMFIARYSSNPTITGNTVINSGDHGIWVGKCWKGLGPSNDAIISHNHVDGAREGGITFCASSGATITDNTVTNVKGEEPPAGYSIGAISLKDGVSNVVVSGNNIYGNDGLGTGSGRGIGIDGSWSDIDINHNFIENNAGGGIKVMGSGTGYFRCNSNCISSNTGYGAENTIGVMLDFENNYWGHYTGPYHPTTNPAGQGDQVSDDVDYDPWLSYCPMRPPVGGVWVSINKFELVAPWIGLVSLITVAAVSVVYVKHIKKQQN